jgi:hypothetical protein
LHQDHLLISANPTTAKLTLILLGLRSTG